MVKGASLLTASLIRSTLSLFHWGKPSALAERRIPKDMDNGMAPDNSKQVDTEATATEANLSAATLLSCCSPDNQATCEHQHMHTFDPFNTNVTTCGKL